MDKVTFKRIQFGKLLFFTLFLLVSLNLYSQSPKFTTPTLISGTDKQVGAKYRYPVVTTVDGTDVEAIVTIVAISDATLRTVDNPSNGGLIDRFQPEINTSKADGYVEFEFAFFKSGTYGTAQPIQIDLSSFTLEAIDIDGNEFFDVAIPSNGSYALENPTKITVSTTGTNPTYTRFKGPSESVNTISLLETRYIAVVNFGSLNSVKFRLGNGSVYNTSSNARQSSISFGEVIFIVPIAPIANNDSSLCKNYGAVSIDVTANDVDSNQNINKATVDLNPSASGIQNSLTVSGEGTWSVNPSGVVTFTPLDSFKNNPTPIYYTITDFTLLTSNQAKITITYKPTAPTVNVVNNCDGTSTLTASNYTGTLLWSNGQTTASINVNTAATYTVTQTVNGCTSDTASGIAAPKTKPTAPTVTVVNNCNGTSTLTASNYTGTLLWSNGQTTASINVNTAATYTVTQTVNGCTSDTASGIAAPKAKPTAPTVNVVNNCDGTSTLTASNYTGTLLWSNGQTSASINVTTAATYTVTQTVNGCTSDTASGIAAPKNKPTAPTVTVVNNCDGTSTLTASNYTGTLLWSNGQTTASINVTTATTYTVTQTVNGCTSNTATGIAAPKAKPTAPTVTVVNNCNGTSTLTASNYTGTLLWSNGQTTASINVNTAATYTVTQTVNSCTSDTASGIAAPKAKPTAPTVTVVNNCDGTSTLTASNYTGTLLWSNGQTTASINVNTAATYTVTQTVNGCTSDTASGIAAPKNKPTAPTVNVVNNCNGTSTLTASNYTGTLLWSNGQTTASINVTTAATYTVTQTVNGCTSDTASGIAAPKNKPTAPTVTVVNNCDGTSTLTASNYTGTLLWSNGQTTASINVNTAATYTVTQTVNGCTSDTASGIAAPKTKPTAPTVTVSTQPSCDNPVGSILLSGLPSGNWTINPGNISGNTTTKTISELVPGTYNFTVTNSLGCTSEATPNTIISNFICANDDTAPTATNGLTGGTAFTNVLVNDKLNGVLVDPTKVNTTFVSATNAGITLVGTDVKVAAGTPAGDYELVYKICEKINLTNCDEATVKVKVSAATIEANDDTAPTATNGFTGGTAFTNVLVNDKLNGVLVDPTKVNTTFVSATNAGISLVGTDVKVAAGTPAGDYELVYKICEKINPTNCDEATVKVKVSAATIEANDDTAPTATNGFTGGTAFTNVLVNDKLNGVLVDPTKVNTTFVSATNAGITLVGTDVKVAAGTPAGDYELVYKICEKINLTNCDEATVKVKVSAATIEANDDTAPTATNGFTGGTAFTNVLVNDKLNGVLVDPTKVNTTFVSATNAGISLVGTDVKVAAGTPAGDYELVYKICEKINPTNCDEAIVKVKVSAATIEANDDTAPTATNGLTGGTAFTNVLVNDKLNGVLVDPTKVNTTFVSATNAGITLVGTDVKVAAGTPAGDYELVYKICEKINPTNCDEAIVKVKVSAATIEANDDTAPTATNGLTGGTAFTNVLVNDKLNGVLVDPTKVNTTFVSATNAGISLVGTDVKVAAGTPAGDYELVYKICEKINPTNCDEATVKVKVSAATIEANDDTAPTATNGFTGGTAFTNVLVNDKLNGVLVDPTKVNTTFVSATNAGISLVGTDVKVAAGTPAGDYELVYKICEKINPTNCDDAKVIVNVYIPSISITKEGTYVDTNGDSKTNVGDQIKYTFTVKNTGGSILTGVTVTDNKVTVNGGPIDLNSNETDSNTFSAIYNITEEDINKGIVYNLALAKGTPPVGNPVTGTSTDPTPCTTCPKDPECLDCTMTPLSQNPSISITKDGTYVDTNADGKTNVGDKINYTFVVKNTGNVTLTNVTVTDNNAVVTGGPIATLAVGTSDDTTFTASHTLTQEDINAGIVYNLATATGKDPKGNPVTGTSTDPTPCTTCPKDPECLDCTMTPLSQNPSISITKDGTYVDTNADGKTNVGDKINYTFVVKNTGNVILTNVTVTDNNAVVTGGPIATLAVGTSDDTTFTASHTLTQEDINAGIVYNLATATGKDPKGNPVTGTSTDPTPCTTCPKDPECLDCTMTPLSQNPSISITKDGTYVDTNADGKTNVGDKINYTFVVKNTGNVILTNVTVTDNNAVVTGGPIATLAVGASDDTTFTASHTLTQEDINAGIVYNLATATGKDPKENPVTGTSTDPTPCTTCPKDPECLDCTMTPLSQNPSISITKDGTYVDTNADGKTNVGDKINYTFVVKNTGNVTLTNVTVTDNNAVVTGGPIATLALGTSDNTTFSASHTLTQEDINAGIVYNLATATGKDPKGNPVTGTSTDPTPCTTCPKDPECLDCTMTPLSQNPSISITKDGTYVDTNADGKTNVGDKINYTFVVKNTGNVTLTNVTVTDNNAVVTGGPIATLALGTSDNTTFSASHTLTQEDINAGIVYNLATATGKDPKGNPVTGTSTDPTPCTTCPKDPECLDCTMTPLSQNPSISITKDGTYVDTNADGKTNVGDKINYTFVVKNTGNVTLTNVTVTDNNAVVTGGPIATLAVGTSDDTTFTASHTLTQEDINAGIVYNLATATGKDPKGNPVTGTSTDPTPCTTCPKDPECLDCTMTPLSQNPSISITKDGTYVDTNADGKTNVGDKINYTFVVKNTGNVILTNVTVTDNNAVVTGGPIATLAVGTSDDTTFTASHTLTQEDINAGIVYNLATATGKDPKGNPVTGTSTDPTPCTTCPKDPECLDCTMTPLSQNPSISITKDGTYVDTNADGKTNVGDKINYTFVVKNTGNVTLTNVTVTDNNAVVTGGPIATLAVGTSDDTTFTASHTLTQEDINAGIVYNLATATGKDPKGNPVTGTSTDPTPCTTCPKDPECLDCTMTPLSQNPSISITKDGTYVDTNADGKTNVGDKINYTFVVKNTGNVILTNVTVTDNNAVVTGGPIATLAVGTSDDTTFTASHTLTQEDINAGIVYNLATATGKDPKGNPVTGTSTDPTPCTTCPKDPECLDCTMTPLSQNPSISITKDGTYVDTNADGKTNVGDKINYTFVVKNTGNVTLTNVTVTDNNAVVTGGPIATLAVGTSDDTTFTASHTLTQEDINAGIVYNLATATGKDPKGNPVTGTSTDPTPCTTCPKDPECLDCTMTPLSQNPSISITKDGTYVDTNADGKTNVGDKINYTFVVKNTGNVTLTNVTVTDNNAVVTGGPIATLAVGTSDDTTFTASHTLTQEDINAGIVYNLATATGKDPKGNPVTGTSTDPTPCTTCPKDPECLDCTMTPLSQNPSISITKDGTYVDTNADGKTNVGDKINYTFVVKNTGNVTLTNVTVTDNNAVVTGGPIATLAVGTSDDTTFTASHTLTQEDINAGIVYNLATATGKDPKGNPVTGTSTDPTPCTTCPKDPECLDCTMTPLSQNPSIALVKTGIFEDTNNDGFAQVGEKVNYFFTVTNTGNVTITNIIVTDPMIATISNNTIASLAPGTVVNNLRGTYILTQTDIDNGKVTNTALAKGKAPKGNDVQDISGTDVENDTKTETPLPQKGAIALVKTAIFVDTNNDGIAQAGEKITYNFNVTNTGSVTLTNIVLTDTMLPTITGNTIATLLPGASIASITGTYTLTQSDIDNGKVINTALVIGKDTSGNEVKDISGTTVENDTKTETVLPSKGNIAVLKTATFEDNNNDGFAQAGETIKYSFEIKNTGNVTLYNVVLTDDLAGVILNGSPISILAPGEINYSAYSAIYPLTQADIVKGFVSNQATVIGKTRFGSDVTAISSSTSNLEEEPTVLGVVGCVVDPLKAVSPNGDGDNDVFYIRGIECYPDNKVEIYNRWGVLVFERDLYNNTDRAFKGRSEGRVTVSQSSELPTGTYYYIVNYKDTDAVLHQKAGYLYLNR
ncbi:DUF7507 domain-containing protein [Flavobacterium faecale]|uniref:DUF7507 domain-containing protein n=1 Tax=Flavobacterium faecale TaxID=1355330 RepID=UPI003AADDBB7